MSHFAVVFFFFFWNGLTIVGLDLHALKRVRSLQISEEVMIISVDKHARSPARQRWGFNAATMNVSVPGKQTKLLEVQTGSFI